MEASTLSWRIRFGKFEVDPESYELLKDGRPVRLHGQPIRILLMLLERPGHLVTREELQQRLWPRDTFVDFDYGLNAAIKRLRESLGDSSDKPRYIETLPRLGYRFIFPLEGKPPESHCPVSANSASGFLCSRPAFDLLPKRHRALILASAVAGLAIISALIWKWFPHITEQQPSIVVLPFDGISPAHDNEHLATGLTDEIIAKLSQVRALRVISRTTATALKGTHKTSRAIAEEVNARYMLEGSIAETDKTVHIRAKLIDAPSDTLLYAYQRSGTSEDLFDMLEVMSRSVAEELRLNLSPAEKRRIAHRPITNIQAYDAYLRARNAIKRFQGGKELDEALQFPQDSLKLNGENALIYAGLAYVHFQYANLGLKMEDHYAKAGAYAEQALSLDPETAQAYMVQGLLNSWFRGNQRQAIRQFKQALAIDPNEPDVLYWLLAIYNMSGRTSTAMTLANRLMEIDPLNAFALDGLAWVYHCDRLFGRSIDARRRCLAVRDTPDWRFSPAFDLACAGKVEEARAVLGPIQAPAHPDGIDVLCDFFRLALRGEKAEVPELNPDFVASYRKDPVASLVVADLYAMLGEREQALDWLETAVNRGFINYLLVSQYDPFFAKFHDDPRFQQLMVRVKGEWERFQE